MNLDRLLDKIDPDAAHHLLQLQLVADIAKGAAQLIPESKQETVKVEQPMAVPPVGVWHTIRAGKYEGNKLFACGYLFGQFNEMKAPSETVYCTDSSGTCFYIPFTDF